MLLLGVHGTTWAQGYSLSDADRFHYSSVYYVALQDADGRNSNNDYWQNPAALGAFVGDELRGVGQTWTSATASGFMIRVWAGETDPSSVTFRLLSGQLEYSLGKQTFSPGADATYGSPSAPIRFTVQPITDMQVSPTSITLKVDEHTRLTPKLVPANHSETEHPITYIYKVDNNATFVSVSDDGEVSALRPGRGSITVQAVSGGLTVFSVVVPVTVQSSVPPESLEPRMPELRCAVGDDITDWMPNALRIYPEEAETAPLGFRIDDLAGSDILELTAAERLVARRTGSVWLTVYALDDPSVQCSFSVIVTNPARDIQIKQDVLNLHFTQLMGMYEDVSQAVKDNVSFLPADFEQYGDDQAGIMGCPMFMTEGDPILNISTTPEPSDPTDYMLDAMLWGGGETKVTVQLAVPDYEAMAGKGWADPKIVEKSFTVKATSIVTSIELPEEIRLESGQTLDLTKVITLLPENHEPFDYSTLEWNIRLEDEEYISIKDNVLTALSPNVNGVYLSVSVPGMMLSASTTVKIVKPLKSITVRDGYDYIEVVKGDAQGLTEAISNAFIFTPADHTDEVSYSTEDTGTVLISRTWQGDYEFTPANGGTATVTAMTYDDMLQPVLSASVKVKVLVPLDGLSFSQPFIKLRPGDDITDLLRDLVWLNPVDADIVNLRFEVTSGDAVEQTAQGRFIAKRSGVSHIQVSSVDRPWLTADLEVDVVNPATDIAFKKSELVYDIRDADLNTLSWQIAQDIHDNIIVKPEDFEFFGDWSDPMTTRPDIHSSNDAILNVHSYDVGITTDFGVDAMLQEGGVVDISVRIYVPDYLEGLRNNNPMPAMTVVERSFRVKIIQVATGITLPQRLMMIEGQKIDLNEVAMPYPEAAVLDYDNLQWSFPSEYDTNIKIEGHTLTALKPLKGSIRLTASLKGTDISGQTELFVVKPVESITVRDIYKSVTVDEGDTQRLTSYVEHAFVVEPDDYTEELFYVLGDETVVRRTDEGFVPLKGGRTTISLTAYTYDAQGNPSSVRLQATMTVTVNHREPVHVESIVLLSQTVQVAVGDRVNPALGYTVMPQNADDKSVTLEIINPGNLKVLDIDGLDNITALAEGTAKVKITSKDNPKATATVTVEVFDVADDLQLTFPGELVLSRYSDVTLSFTKSPQDAKVLPTHVQFLFDESPNKGWGPVATARATDDSGLHWAVRGLYAGVYHFQVRYDGVLMRTTTGETSATVVIPAEYPFAKGWDWISIYQTSAADGGQIALKNGNQWVSPLLIDADNKVIELRSQEQTLYNDPQEGPFGDLQVLSPTGGMYKVKSTYTDARAASMMFSAGAQNLIAPENLRYSQVHQGYTWISYPHELNHSLSALAPYLEKTAERGDLIIGKEFFAEFDGKEWIALPQFCFEAGKGYIYYTESESQRNIDWGPATLAPEPALARQSVSLPAGLRSAAHDFADNMAVVAECSIDNGQLTIDNGQCSMVNAQWSMVNGQWSMKSGSLVPSSATNAAA